MNSFSIYEFRYVELLLAFFCAMIIRCVYLGFYVYPKEFKNLEGANRSVEAENSRLLMRQYRVAYLWRFIGLAIVSVFILGGLRLVDILKQAL